MHHSSTSERGDAAVGSSDPQDYRRLVVGTGLLMVAAHVAFRGWAAYRSYFYADDYTLLSQARDQSLDLGFLGSTYAGHLLPAGRLITWVVSNTGTLNWGMAATTTMFLEALTCLAALWMFLTVFGARWGALGPLALYLTTAITLPAFVWWGATILQLGTQLAFFVAVGSWVRYLRSRRLRWALLAYLAVAVGVAFDIKAMVVLPVVAYLALAYFAEGSPWRRVLTVLRSYWAAAFVGLTAVGVYVVFFMGTVDSPTSLPTMSIARQVLSTSLGESLPSAVVGGPWVWSQNDVQPTQSADPPDWMVHLSWVLIAAVVIYGVLRRHATLRAWGVLLLGFAMDYVLLLAVRAAAFGPGVAREYRFFTDLAPFVALAVGLAFMRLPGAVQSTREREEPLLLVRLGPRTLVPLVAVVCVSGLVSQTLYARTFHGALGSKAYMRNLDRGLEAHGKVALVDRELPENVSPSLITPWNRVSVMTNLLSDQASFPEATSNLAVVADDGTLREAEMEVVLNSDPGPREGCGWLAQSIGVTVPLEATAIEFVWWLRIAYLSGDDSPVTVTAGGSTVHSTVQAGLGSLWVRVTGTFDRVQVSGLDEGVSMCVDKIEVGTPEPGDYL
jgi:hypothetical protein